MASLPSVHFHPYPLSPLYSPRTVASPGLRCRTQWGFCRAKNPSLFVARLGLDLGPHLPDPEGAHELLARAEGLLYTIADAAVSSSEVAAEGSKKGGDWLSGITDYLETVLKVLKNGLSALHVPYSYGFAIILLTVLVKGATFPLTKKQVESALAMRTLQPQVKAIQQRYAGDQERIQLETARLYKLAGVNPLAGCLPTLVTIPVWIGLYRALSNVANEGLLTEGFFWIPSLAGPTTITARQSGSGTSWLFPFADGHPPLGWSDTLAYLVLPVLLIISQYISAQIMQPSQAGDPSQKNTQLVSKLLPLMIGYFALSVPSGLSLYWFTNNILSMAQQIWLQKLGGAKNPVRHVSDRTAKDEQSNTENSTVNIQKSMLDIDKVQSSQPEKENPGGLLRGERFKQIKEQEAKRRKQREEERRIAAETSKSSQITHQQHLEVKSVESKNEQVSEKDHKGLCVPSGKNPGVNGNGGSIRRDDESPREDVSKEGNAEMHASSVNNTSQNDAPDRSDHQIERDQA